MSNHPTPRPGVEAMRPYKPGGRAISGAVAPIKLSANESALGPSPKAVEALKNLSGFERYPDPSGWELREAIANRENLDPNKILLGMGSDEILHTLVRGYAADGDEIVYSDVTFPLYGLYVKSINAVAVRPKAVNYVTPVQAYLDAVTDKTKIVVVANPNNPTGAYVPQSDMEALRAGLPDHVLLVIDGAYAEYVDAPDFDSGAALVEATGNTVMTRTFSKLHGMAGMRLGWCYAHEEIISVAGRVRSPFNISTASSVMGLAAVLDTDHQDWVISHTKIWREKLAQAARGWGWQVAGTEANFVCIGFPDEEGRRADDADAALKSAGIIVREMSTFGLPNHLRITIGTEDEMTTCLAALKSFAEG